MMTPGRVCPNLSARLAASATMDEEDVAALVTAHTATCPACAAAEAALDDLMTHYRAQCEAPLTNTFTERLLRQVCASRGEERIARPPTPPGPREA